MSDQERNRGKYFTTVISGFWAGIGIASLSPIITPGLFECTDDLRDTVKTFVFSIELPSQPFAGRSNFQVVTGAP
jgi:hypothetical protein